MSELNWYWVYVPYLDAPNRQQDSAIRAGYNKVVFKSEADKVIANRDYEIEKLKESISNLLKMKTEQVMDEVMEKALIYGEGFVSVEHVMKLVSELCHQKYKRCLAMAMWCEATALWCYQAANTLPSGFHATLNGKRVMIEPARLYNRFWILTKWNRRWLELAAKFKKTK